MAKTKVSSFEAGPWTITSTKSHILRSKCEKMLENGCQPGKGELCVVCRFEKLLELPALPEMVFGDNKLTLQHCDGYGIVFETLEALKLVNNHHDLLKVADAEEWAKTRAGLSQVKGVVKPFDWTYTTDYKGSLFSDGQHKLEVVETSERIDIEKLKAPEKIHFFDEIILYEDELHDHGCAVLNVKVRVMASGFLVLQRFFLRVDGVLVRINDTRLYHAAQTDYLLREYTAKEAKIQDIRLPPSMLTDPNKLSTHLPVTSTIVHKLIMPATTQSDT